MLISPSIAAYLYWFVTTLVRMPIVTALPPRNGDVVHVITFIEKV